MAQTPLPPPSYQMDVRFDEQSHSKSRALLYLEKGLMQPIPPLHIQQQIVNQNVESAAEANGLLPIKADPSPLLSQALSKTNPELLPPDQLLRSLCSRCKKDFDQPLIIPTTNNKDGGVAKFLTEPKLFKLCQHCRDLQRQRLRRWQKKTKDKQGACRRCGSDIPVEEQKFVLCPLCRQNLRKRKANRAAQGRCVHCLGPLDASIITEDGKKEEKDEDGNVRPRMGNYKVCERCRENDKIRRTNLEKMGNCNRCAKTLDALDVGKHKVCLSCRTRKKKLSQNMNGGGAGNGTGAIIAEPAMMQPPMMVNDQMMMPAGLAPLTGQARPAGPPYLQFAYTQSQQSQQAFNQAMQLANRQQQNYAAALGVKVGEFPYQQ